MTHALGRRMAEEAYLKATDESKSLKHYGRKGMKWGQNIYGDEDDHHKYSNDYYTDAEKAWKEWKSPKNRGTRIGLNLATFGLAGLAAKQDYQRAMMEKGKMKSSKWYQEEQKRKTDNAKAESDFRKKYGMTKVKDTAFEKKYGMSLSNALNDVDNDYFENQKLMNDYSAYARKNGLSEPDFYTKDDNWQKYVLKKYNSR